LVVDEGFHASLQQTSHSSAKLSLVSQGACRLHVKG